MCWLRQEYPQRGTNSIHHQFARCYRSVLGLFLLPGPLRFWPSWPVSERHTGYPKSANASGVVQHSIFLLPFVSPCPDAARVLLLSRSQYQKQRVRQRTSFWRVVNTRLVLIFCIEIWSEDARFLLTVDGRVTRGGTADRISCEEAMCRTSEWRPLCYAALVGSTIASPLDNGP